MYCAIVGNVLVPGGVGSNNACAEISSSSAWRQLAEGISTRGTVAGIRLATAWRGYRGRRTFVPAAGADALHEYRQVPASMSSLDVKRTFDALCHGSELAFQAGFRHLQPTWRPGVASRLCDFHSGAGILQLTRMANSNSLTKSSRCQLTILMDQQVFTTSTNA